jgi:hypothetical protein
MTVAKVLIQLRISPDERDELRDAGTIAGRSLPNEIMHRLGEYLRGDPGSPERAIGDLAAMITARANDQLALYPLAEGEGHVPQLLAVVRDAMTIALNGLGAIEAPFGDKDFPVPMGITWDLPGRMKTPSESDETPEGKKLARIGKALGFAKAKNTEGSSKGGKKK